MHGIFDLKKTHNPHRWFLAVVDDICVGGEGRRFMFGGVGLAAAVQAMEHTSGRPVIWATAHYLSFARPGSIVDFDVWIPAQGRAISQANVIAHIKDRQIITVHAALGERDDPLSDQWLEMPGVPAPDDCPAVQTWRSPVSGLVTRFETRLASGIINEDKPFEGRGDGHLVFWMRSREGLLADAQLLAVAADYVATALSGAIGRPAGGNSLDNTIRYGRIEPVEWFLCDVRIEMAHHGIVHGVMHLYAPNGRLMASASQSLIIRYRDTAETPN